MPRPYKRGDEALEVVVVRPPADRGADEAAPGQVAHDDARLREPRDDVRRLVRGNAPGDERRALLRNDDVAARPRASRDAEALRHLGGALVRPLRDRRDRGAQPGDEPRSA